MGTPCYFVNFHYDSVSIHARNPPVILYGDGDAADPAFRPASAAELGIAARGKNVLFVTHGFNVPYINGVRSLGRLVSRIAPGSDALVVAVLWPGDFYVPAVNYPQASVPAMESGQGLAALCNASLGGALSLSFASHSLGARVVLEAVKGLKGRARMLCVTAGAVNDDCLTGEYAMVPKKTDAVYTLASVNDWVLQIAYPAGDLIGQLFTSDHGAFQEALGRHGPQPRAPAPVTPWQIPDTQDYGHLDYMPSSEKTFPPAPAAPPLSGDNRWTRVGDFIAEAFKAATMSWPNP
jgi:hypothetical protein